MPAGQSSRLSTPAVPKILDVHITCAARAHCLQAPKVPIGAEAWASGMADDVGAGNTNMPVGMQPNSGPPAAIAAAVPDAVAAARSKQPSHGARKAQQRRNAAVKSGNPSQVVRASGNLQQAPPRQGQSYPYG
eukprot:355170-Chlamydomonas_euryale.AAC.1